jgi:tungstate transport system substrate-binding protein
LALYAWPKKIKVNILMVLLLGTLAVGGCQPYQPDKVRALPVLSGEQAQLVLLATKTVQNSGLLEYLLPYFEQETGCRVKVKYCELKSLAAACTQGEAEVVVTEVTTESESLNAAGIVGTPQTIYYDDYLLVGPMSDPAEIRDLPSVVEALQRIAITRIIFITRGDGSAIDSKEKALWQAAGVVPTGKWYQTAGAGVRTALTLASAREAYIFTDRLTFLKQRAGLDLDIMVSGDPLLQRPYWLLPVQHGDGQVHAAKIRSLSVFFKESRTCNLIKQYSLKKYSAPLLFPAPDY